MKKRALVFILCACMLFTFVGCGAQKSSEDKSGKDTEKTEEQTTNESLEGKIVIYTSMYEDIIDQMKDILDEKFPNLEVEFFQAGTGTLQSKIAAELDSGKLGCDMIMVAEPAYALELKENNILHPYKFKDADKLLFEYDKDGYWYPVRVCNMVLAYNPDLKKKEELPNSFKDFAYSDKMTGVISMSNPLTSGTAYASIVGLLDKYGEEYFKKLSDRKVAIESGSVALTKLETGECDEIMILEESILKKREEEGSNLEVIYPTDGTLCLPSPIMIVDDKYCANNNLKACEAVEEWFLSLEGQKYIVSGWMHSVREDYPDPPYDSIKTSEIISKSMPVDWEKCYKERESIRTLFQNNVTIPEK